MSLGDVLFAAAAINLIVWAAFRLDKHRAQRGGRRIRERTLLLLATLGGLGAALAMYAHRQRHKTAKPRFVIVVIAAALAQVAAGLWIAGSLR